MNMHFSTGLDYFCVGMLFRRNGSGPLPNVLDFCQFIIHQVSEYLEK